MGQAGSGKSVLIKSISNAIRTIFDCENTVAICGPTGSAAFNAGGYTMHNMASLETSCSFEIPAAKRRRLLDKFDKLIAVIIDERSMIGSDTLGRFHYTLAETAYGGSNNDKSWGNIPIVILIGDDYQLPPVQPGAFYAFDVSTKSKNISSPEYLLMRRKGNDTFIEAAQNTMQLRSIKRQDPDQQRDCFDTYWE
jgi:hypothetical protein